MNRRWLGVAVALASIVAVPHPAAAAAPSISADPSTGLSDGEWVHLTYTGFTHAFAFRQCRATAVAIATGCTAVNTKEIAVPNATGGGDLYVPVYADGDPQLENDGQTGQITCDAQHPCALAAMTDTTSLATAVLIPLSFAPSPGACPSPNPATAVLGGASSSAYRVMYAWESAVCLAPHNLSVGYEVTNSVDGVNNFLNPPTAAARLDFAVTGPLDAAPPASSTTFKYAPLTASALVLAYHMYNLNPDGTQGTQITDLTLTPQLIAQIFTGQAANWRATPAITALNPNDSFPPRVQPFVRADHGSQSFVFTSWLHATVGSTWAGSAQSSTPSNIYPSQAAGVTEVTGSTNLVLGVEGISPIITDFTEQGTIGFMDSSTAAYNGLPVAKIQMPGGAVVSATSSTIAQAFDDATLNPDGTLAFSDNNPDPAAYPIPMPGYMMAPTNTIPGPRGVTLAAFLNYAVTTGQTLLPRGYAPLPAKLVAASEQVAGAIPTESPATAGQALLHLRSLPPPIAPSLNPAHSLPPPRSSGPAAIARPRAVKLGPEPISLLAGSGSRYVLPSIVAIAFVALTAGAVLETFGRRRRAGRRQG